MISGNGRYIVYNDGGSSRNIYIYDRVARVVEQINPFLFLNDIDYLVTISSDGRYITYSTKSPNVVPSITSSSGDIYVYDRQTHETVLVSIDSSGNQGNGLSLSPIISFDGRYVVFESLATNLVPNDTNNKKDVFVRDLLDHTTTRISVSTDGTESNGDSFIRNSIDHIMSSDNKYIVFSSLATNLAPGVSDGSGRVYNHDLQTGTTEVASLNNQNEVVDNGSGEATISGNGRYILFSSAANNLTPLEKENAAYYYVRDRQTGMVYPINIDSSGGLVKCQISLSDIDFSGDNLIFSCITNGTNSSPYINGHQLYFRHMDYTNLTAPSVSEIIANPSLIVLGNSLTTSATITDQQSSDLHYARWDWGDGTITDGLIIESNGSGTVSGSHTYSNVGVYEIKLTVRDNSGLATQVNYQYVSVYDPSPNSIFTGVRTFSSPIGAYVQNPNLTGQVQFGIVARYSGAQATARVSMNFKDAGLNFESTTATILVSANGKATLRGVGTVNGTGNYRYLITGIDGGQSGEDLIRFQIINEEGNVLYDTQPTLGDTVDPITTINGQIIIH